jgi:DNA-binding transcriptional ArsR family regulator
MSIPLTDLFLGMLAARLQALSEPTRIRLLMTLERHPASVGELVVELTTTHQNVSKHLNVLYKAGLVRRRRTGRQTIYELADYSACRLIEESAASLTGYVEELASIAGLEVTA